MIFGANSISKKEPYKNRNPEIFLSTSQSKERMMVMIVNKYSMGIGFGSIFHYYARFFLIPEMIFFFGFTALMFLVEPLTGIIALGISLLTVLFFFSITLMLAIIQHGRTKDKSFVEVTPDHLHIHLVGLKNSVVDNYIPLQEITYFAVPDKTYMRRWLYYSTFMDRLERDPTKQYGSLVYHFANKKNYIRIGFRRTFQITNFYPHPLMADVKDSVKIGHVRIMIMDDIYVMRYGLKEIIIDIDRRGHGLFFQDLGPRLQNRINEIPEFDPSSMNLIQTKDELDDNIGRITGY